MNSAADTWGGVYSVSFLILCVNVALVLALLDRTKRALCASVILLVAVAVIVIVSNQAKPLVSSGPPSLYVVAVQPNVPMEREGLIGQADGSRPRPVLGRAYEMVADWDQQGAEV